MCNTFLESIFKPIIYTIYKTFDKNDKTGRFHIAAVHTKINPTNYTQLSIVMTKDPRLKSLLICTEQKPSQTNFGNFLRISKGE